MLAATGEGAANGLSVATGALWSGAYDDRFSQLQPYTPDAGKRKNCMSRHRIGCPRAYRAGVQGLHEQHQVAYACRPCNRCSGRVGRN